MATNPSGNEPSGTEAEATKKTTPFRPFIICLLLGALFLGWTYHRKKAATTILSFRVRIEGKEASPDKFTAYLNGRVVKSGERIPWGRHHFKIDFPKIGSREKKFFAGYGPNDVGTFDFQWVRGYLDVRVHPLAKEIRLSTDGHPDIVLRNSTGERVSLPVGSYRGVAEFGEYVKKQTAEVVANQTNVLDLVVPLGSMEITSDVEGGEFEVVSDAISNLKRQGSVPGNVPNLPVGLYSVRFKRGKLERTMRISVEGDFTKQARFTFNFGRVVVNSEPEGCTVVNEQGRELGRTPLQLNEMNPGTYRLKIERYNHDSEVIEVKVAGGDTQTVKAVLTSTIYRTSMKEAREEFEKSNPDLKKVMDLLGDALRAKPNDEAATALRKDARFKIHFDNARYFREKDLPRAIKEIEEALQFKPDDTKAVEFKGELQKQKDAAVAVAAERKQTQELERLKKEASKHFFALQVTFMTHPSLLFTHLF